MDKTILFILVSGVIVVSKASLQLDVPKTRVFDTELYNRVINSTECERQMTYLKSRSGLMLLARFLDAGVRLPRGVFMLLLADLGNYNQCLKIDEKIEDMKIEGKYVLFRISFNQTLRLPSLEEIDLLNEKKTQLRSILKNEPAFSNDEDSFEVSDILSRLTVDLAACLPKSCTLDDWVKNVLFDVNNWGIEINELFYRLPDDKPWVPADYVAITIFSTLAFITVLSTLYDINHTVIKKQDPKKANIYYRTFSVYTNTSRLLTFTSNPNALDCLDGIRSISMMWVILGHSFQTYTYLANILETISFLTSVEAIFISTGLFTVDSFFMMAGLLLVYTTVGKFSSSQLLKRLPAFYLNRLLRMFPLLAALVLLQASVFHRIVDGPFWTQVAENTAACRTFWWSTLLHIQNYVNPDNICIKHSWYLAIDIQLHIISPLVLYWVLGKNKKAVWAALVIALLAILTGSTVFNFMKDFASSSASLPRMSEVNYYLSNYYMNTLCRGSAFFIGMIMGYIIHIYKGRELKLSKTFVIIAWTIALSLIGFCFYASYEVMQLDWKDQLLDNLFNSFMRGIWSIGLSWMIFACVKGYGGPINWLFTLKLWKLPARISFAMYLYHYPLMYLHVGSQLQAAHFSSASRMFDFFAFLLITFMVSFIVTVVIDAPFSVLIKMLFEGGQRRPRVENGNSKAGPIPGKDGSDLEKYIITTLQKDPYIMEKNESFLEGNGVETKYLGNLGVPFGTNGAIGEKTIQPLDRNEVNGVETKEFGNTEVVFVGNGAVGEKNGQPLDRNEVNEISTLTKDKSILESNGSL